MLTLGASKKIYTLPDSRESISDQQKNSNSHNKLLKNSVYQYSHSPQNIRREFNTFLITIVQSQVSKCTFLLLSPYLHFFVRYYIRTAIYFPKSLSVPQCISTCTLLQPFFLFKAFPSTCVNGILASCLDIIVMIFKCSTVQK